MGIVGGDWVGRLLGYGNLSGRWLGEENHDGARGHQDDPEGIEDLGYATAHATARHRLGSTHRHSMRIRWEQRQPG